MNERELLERMAQLIRGETGIVKAEVLEDVEGSLYLEVTDADGNEHIVEVNAGAEVGEDDEDEDDEDEA